MAIGITFIYSIMKMINWSMGEFYMIGAYIQWILVQQVFGWQYWFIGIPVSMAIVFLFGIAFQHAILKPMFVGGVERRDDYVTIITIACVVLFRNIAVVIYGPYVHSTPEYFPRTYFGTLPMSGSRLMAFIGTVIILGIFYYGIKKTWMGRAFLATAQNRLGTLVTGIDPMKIDRYAYGIGVALAAAAGALLTPVFMVYPLCGAVSTMKGFEIIIIGGLGSIMGSVVGGLTLGMVEIMGTAFINPSYRDLYGFVFLLVILAIKPTGFFGEVERVA